MNKKIESKPLEISGWANKDGTRMLQIAEKGTNRETRTTYLLPPPRAYGTMLSVGMGVLHTPADSRRSGQAERLFDRLHKVILPALQKQTGSYVVHHVIAKEENKATVELTKKMGFLEAKHDPEKEQVVMGKLVYGNPTIEPQASEKKIIDWLMKNTEWFD